ncbi:MAG: DNA-binding protein HU [Gemmatimonadetes bacterium]|jgi:DNA-binding protein HU-beta|nr:DNA-binding protein HU [Gemmatimonadota bacterium]HCK11973.1 DNA-binding protein HU [Candidatus Latescibacterota bacterium]|tara:strand:- start:412 stop:687 length:276 start_codon:yes stop_codon:yes gene_type:complete
MPNKADLIDTIANAADLSKSQAGAALEALLGDITGALSKGERVAIAGFGTFQISERAARQGRNPQTGATIQIAASKNVRFKAGKQLKDAVN